jgi:uncharacterized membrane protein
MDFADGMTRGAFFEDLERRAECIESHRVVSLQELYRYGLLCIFLSVLFLGSELNFVFTIGIESVANILCRL